MITEVKFDQYSFLVDCSVESGDGYHCIEWLDWQTVAGQWTDTDQNILEMSSEEVENESRLFEKYINELLKKELLK